MNEVVIAILSVVFAGAFVIGAGVFAVFLEYLKIRKGRDGHRNRRRIPSGNRP